MSQKYIIYLNVILLAFFGLHSCEETISPPESMRFDLSVAVKDTTGFSQEYFGTEMVDSATVFMNSISYYTFFSSISNENGIAGFPEILPDFYNVSVSKRVSFVFDDATIERTLNGQLTNIEILDANTLPTVYVEPSTSGKLVISEIYYNGSPPQEPYFIPQYFHDQFTEIYNNSDEVVYLDSIIIADLDFGHAEEDFVYAIHAYMFPGTGQDYPLYPGEFVIVAQDAINHTEAVPSSVDLSGADFEYYVGPTDIDQPNTENMIKLHHKYGIDFLYSVFNDAILLLKVKDPFAYGYSQFDCILFPNSAVLDGVDYRDNLAEVDYKRLGPAIDGGLTGGFDSYMNKSIQRRIEFYKGEQPILMDNNNSSIDFQVIDHPTPGYIFDE